MWYNYDKTLKIDVLGFLELYLAKLYRLNISVIYENELFDCEAKTYLNKKYIYIREYVYYNASKVDPRSRHTLMHEAGHLFIHTEGSYKRVDNNYIIPKYEDPEWQASVFAGEFLAPSCLIGNRTVEEIMEDFGVSRSCAEIQYKNKSIRN